VIATAILVLLVGLLGWTPHQPPAPGTDPNGPFVGPVTVKSPASPAADAQPPRPAPDTGNRTAGDPQPPLHTYEAETPVLADVAKFVRESGKHKQSTVILKGDLNLNRDDPLKESAPEPGLVFDGPETSTLVIKGRSPEARPLIRLASDPNWKLPSVAALTVKGGTGIC